MGFFLKFSPSITVPIFYAWITVSIILKLFFGTAIGILLIAVAMYAYAPSIFGVIPLSSEQLIMWFSGLSESYKVAALTSFLTISGFVVAFHTATINWRAQLNAQIKSQSSGELEEFFSIVSGLVSDAEIFVNSMVDAVNKIQKTTDIQEAKFAVSWVVSQSQKFFSTRAQISQAQVQVHRLKGRHYTVLTTGWGLPDTFDKAISSLNEIGTRMWVHVPVVDERDSNYLQTFLTQVNVQECKEFIDAASKYSGPMSMLAGSIKGYLMSPVIGFSLPMYIGLVSVRKEFSEGIRKLHRTMNERQ